ERVVEKFLVGAPPERIVHDCCSSEGRVLEPGAIKRHVLRDAVDHYVVTARLPLDHLVDLDELRDDIPSARFLIHPLNKRRRKAVLLAKKDPDFFHNIV